MSDTRKRCERCRYLAARCACAEGPLLPGPRPRAPQEPGDLMTPAEVADFFRVGRRAVTRWADEGKLTFTRTLGGHRRYIRAEVEALSAATRTERAQ